MMTPTSSDQANSARSAILIHHSTSSPRRNVLFPLGVAYYPLSAEIAKGPLDPNALFEDGFEVGATSD